MADSKWPPLFIDKMIFFDKIKNKIDRDKIVVSLPTFSGARNPMVISTHKLDHLFNSKSKWPP